MACFDRMSDWSPWRLKSMFIDDFEFSCPYCGETNATDIDPANVGHSYVEDCQVCCRPIVITLNRVEDEVVPYVKRENE